MLSPNDKSYRRVLGNMVLACLFAASGCELKTTVGGTVRDVKGEQLPGVAVTLRGTELQDVTSGVGAYALRCPAGPAVLDFIKTGYTQGRLDITVPESGTIQATEVRLWPLPAGQGVYLYEDFRYRDATRVEPQPVRVAERGPVYASKLAPTLKTFNAQPLIIYTALPSYDAALYRLVPVAIAPGPGQTAAADSEPVWVVDVQVSAVAVPVDEPEHVLLELRPTEPLLPGVYAVSWGAFDGYTSTHASAYLFEVRDPNAPDASAEVVPPTEGAPAGTEGGPTEKTKSPNAAPAPVEEPAGGLEG